MSDIKYIQLIKSDLPLATFSDHNVNFRCVYCGDSRHNKNKKRAYLITKNGGVNYYYYCHNCNINITFSEFIRINFPMYYKEYILDKFKEKSNINSISANINVDEKMRQFDKIDLGMSLYHITKYGYDKKYKMILDYVESRKIPHKYYSSLYAVNDISYVSKQIPKYAESNFNHEPVLCIPFFDKNKDYSFICNRTITPNAFIRYITFNLIDDTYRIWGIEYIDLNKKIYVFEGAIDAMSFDNNSLALSGLSHKKSIDYLAGLSNKKNIVFVYDNDVIINKDVCRQAIDRIDEGFSIYIPKNSNFKYKDINKAIVEGVSKEEIKSCIDDRTFCGLIAKIELSKTKNKK